MRFIGEIMWKWTWGYRWTDLLSGPLGGFLSTWLSVPTVFSWLCLISSLPVRAVFPTGNDITSTHTYTYVRARIHFPGFLPCAFRAIVSPPPDLAMLDFLYSGSRDQVRKAAIQSLCSQVQTGNRLNFVMVYPKSKSCL